MRRLEERGKRDGKGERKGREQERVRNNGGNERGGGREHGREGGRWRRSRTKKKDKGGQGNGLQAIADDEGSLGTRFTYKESRQG